MTWVARARGVCERLLVGDKAGAVNHVSDGTVARQRGRGVYPKGIALIHFDEQPFDVVSGGTETWMDGPPGDQVQQDEQQPVALRP